jgi:hypothetical protein
MGRAGETRYAATVSKDRRTKSRDEASVFIFVSRVKLV